jgi:integration host factor subunit alpha
MATAHSRSRRAQPKGMTKADLVDVVYKRHGGLTKSEASAIVDAILAAVKTTLVGGRTVKITNFGTFEVKERPGRLGVNPVSGERMVIPHHRGLTFRPARNLKKEVAPRDDKPSSTR